MNKIHRRFDFMLKYGKPDFVRSVLKDEEQHVALQGVRDGTLNTAMNQLTDEELNEHAKYHPLYKVMATARSIMNGRELQKSIDSAQELLNRLKGKE